MSLPFTGKDLSGVACRCILKNLGKIRKLICDWQLRKHLCLEEEIGAAWSWKVGIVRICKVGVRRERLVQKVTGKSALVNFVQWPDWR